MDRKRIILIVAFVLSVVVFGWLLYYFFFRSLIPGGPLTNGANINGEFPIPTNGNISIIGNENRNVSFPGFGGNIDITAPTEVAHGGLTKVIDVGTVPVQNFSSGAAGTFYYDSAASQFFRLDGDKAVALSDKKFFNVQNVTWTRAQDKAILEYPDGSNIVYDFKADKQITLPKELTDFSFDSSGENIAAKWIGTKRDENWLMTGNADGSGFRIIEPLGDRAHNVEVAHSPNNQVIALVRDPVDADSQEILPIGALGENFKSFTVDGLKFESRWAPTGNSLLYNVTTANNNYEPSLWLTSGTTQTLGASHTDLKLNTWASKCTFGSSGDTIYCAEPTSLPRGVGLYPELANGIPDAFYRIDLRSGQKIPLAFPVGSQAAYSAASLHLSPDESLLYFVDSVTQKVHALRLN